MNLIDQVIRFAANAHDGQYREGTSIPYITHPFAVGMLLQQANCSIEVIAAGILHDTIEDTYVTYTDLQQAFGQKIANLVQAASEQDKSLPWEQRKKHTIQQLRNASLEEVQVIVADILHNMKSIHEDLQQHGEIVWQRFNRGKQAQHWYYTTIHKAIANDQSDFPLIRELENEELHVFGSLDFDETTKI